MKYLITESQLDRVIFKYLDNQDFIQIEKDDNIYFVNSEDDKYCQIRYDMSDNWSLINYELVDEISSFFSLNDSVSEKIITLWIGNTLQSKYSYGQSMSITNSQSLNLRLPYD
jgi:hypothetical protein